jgi:hypothetical protein
LTQECYRCPDCAMYSAIVYWLSAIGYSAIIYRLLPAASSDRPVFLCLDQPTGSLIFSATSNENPHPDRCRTSHRHGRACTSRRDRRIRLSGHGRWHSRFTGRARGSRYYRHSSCCAWRLSCGARITRYHRRLGIVHGSLLGPPIRPWYWVLYTLSTFLSEQLSAFTPFGHCSANHHLRLQVPQPFNQSPSSQPDFGAKVAENILIRQDQLLEWISVIYHFVEVTDSYFVQRYGPKPVSAK